MVLHALKHRTFAVNAALIGRPSSAGDCRLRPSIPLPERSPPSPRNLPNDDYHDVVKNIGDHITRYFARGALLLLDNKKLEVLKNGKDRSPVMQLYTKDASRSWKLVGSDGSSKLAIKEPSANIVLLDYISSEKWKDILDFGDHLDDISKDWPNSELFQ